MGVCCPDSPSMHASAGLAFWPVALCTQLRSALPLFFVHRPQMAAACCRLSTAWRWAQHPSVFAAALQRGLPGVAAQLEDPAAVEAVMRCVEPAAPSAAPSDPLAAAAAAEFLAAVAAQPVHSAPATDFAAAAGPLAVPTPAQPAPLSTSTLAGQNPAAAAAAAAGGGGHWDAAGGSGQWEAPPQQYRRVVTLVPEPAEQQRPKREREDRDSPPGKRPRSEASPVPPQRSVDRFLEGSLADWKRRQIEEDVPPGGRREALLVRAVERSCPAGQERQAGDLGNALRRLDRWGMQGWCMLAAWWLHVVQVCICALGTCTCCLPGSTHHACLARCVAMQRLEGTPGLPQHHRLAAGAQRARLGTGEIPRAPPWQHECLLQPSIWPHSSTCCQVSARPCGRAPAGASSCCLG